MKSLVSKFIAAAIALVSISASTTTAHATPQIDGFCGFLLGVSKTYKPYGAAQTGRYMNLGSGYYRSGSILGCEKIFNNGFYKTGTMSLELWAMPYYGANSGKVSMTLGTPSLAPLKSRTFYTANGNAKSFNSYSFGSVHLFEYTSSGWKFRDEQSKTFPSNF